VVRKLAAIVSVDIVGYSSLSEKDEAAAVAAVNHVREAINALCAKHHGRLFSKAGDGFMVEFGSALDAVRFATALLRRLSPSGPAVRIGAHLGEVRAAQDGDLLGHGVNVAARLMQLAEPRSLLISEAVQRPLPLRLQRLLRAQGPVQLNKMAETVNVHGLAGKVGLIGRLRLARRRPWALTLGIGVASALALAVFWPRPEPTPLVAVLPFESATPDMAIMAQGLADEVITSLAAEPGLRVAARASSFQFTGDRRSEAGQALRARYVLDGAVRNAEGQLSVNAQLSDVRRGAAVVWSETFMVEAGAANLAQRRIAEGVAQAIAGAGRASLAAMDEAVSEEALGLYYAGREARLRRGVYDLDQAIALLTRATLAAPTFDRAWAELAGAQLILADLQPHQGPRLRAAAAENATRALSLNPQNAYAMAVRAGLEPPQAWAARRAWLDQAVQLAPSDAPVLRARARLLSQMGYLEAALSDLVAAETLDPLDGQILLVWTREALGQRTEARALLGRAAQRQARSAWNTRVLFALFDEDYTGAAALLDPRVRPADIGEALPGLFSATAAGLRSRANRAEAIAAWEAAAARDPGLTDDAVLMIGWLGDREAAFALATRAMGAQGEATVFPADLAAAPAFRDLRYDPRYLRLMAHSGLLAYWRQTGVWPDFCADPRLPYACNAATG
jgi:adenylate cyclase